MDSHAIHVKKTRQSGKADDKNADHSESEASRIHIRKRAMAREVISLQNSNVLRIPLSNARKVSAEFSDRADKIEENVREIQEDSERQGPVDQTSAREYILKRSQMSLDLDLFCKDARKAINSPTYGTGMDRKTCKRAREQSNQLELVIAKERAMLVANRAKIQLSTLYHSNHFRLGEAYMFSITESLPLPSGATIEYHSKDQWSSHDQRAFRSNVRATYHVPHATGRGTWCPVAGSTNERLTSAAQIVPQCLGELNASYLFGTDSLGDGYGKLWGVGNGMWVSAEVEEAMDAARIVFVPCSEEVEGEIKMIVLDEDLGNQCIGLDLPFAEVDGKPLKFKTAARPDLHALYIHALITVLRRKTYAVRDWQYDIPKVFTGRNWSNFGENTLRKSTVLALASEIGDLSKEDLKQLELEKSGLVASGGEEATISDCDREMAIVIGGTWMSRRNQNHGKSFLRNWKIWHWLEHVGWNVLK